MKTFQGRVVTPGCAQAEALVSHGGLNTLASFQKSLQFGDKTAKCGDQNNPDLYGKPMAGKALCLPQTIGSTTGGLVLYAAFQFNRLCRHLLRKRLAGAVDDIYADVYRRETAVGRLDDLRQTWDVLRDETASVILSAPLSIPWFAGRTRRRLEALAANLLAAKTA